MRRSLVSFLVVAASTVPATAQDKPLDVADMVLIDR